jgi:PAS domain S-box-containing protein
MRTLVATSDDELWARLQSAASAVGGALERVERLGAARRDDAARVLVDARRGPAPVAAALAQLGAIPVVAVVADARMAGAALDAGASQVLYADEPRDRMATHLRALGLQGQDRRGDPFLSVALNQLAESVEIIEADGRIRYVNPAFEELTGYSAAEAIGRTAAMLLRCDAHPPEYFEAMEETVRRGEVWRGPVVSRRRDGQRITQRVTLSGVYDDGELVAMVAIRREATRENRLEAQLRASERMVALGTLAAGVAHEINNPLAYVLANIEYVTDALEGDEPFDLDELGKVLQEARQGGHRVRAIVSDMNMLAREREDVLEPVDLCTVLDASAAVAKGIMRPVARFERDYRGAPRVLANEARLGQVALNLLVNAAQAIPDDGSPASHRIALRAGTEGGRAFFEVSDDGAGMPEHVRARAFDPFFTTKPPGKGTGLGLSVCHQIVSGFGGELELDSAPGRGTRIRAWLPEAQAAASARPAPPRRREAERPLRVLVVDDEPPVCAALARLLRRHEVEVAHGGAAALERIGQRAFDVVLCDLTMPGMTGPQLREALPVDSALRERWVFVTGGVLTEEDQRYLDSFDGPIVYKPFNGPGIREAVRSAVARRGGAAGPSAERAS